MCDYPKSFSRQSNVAKGKETNASSNKWKKISSLIGIKWIMEITKQKVREGIHKMGIQSKKRSRLHGHA